MANKELTMQVTKYLVSGEIPEGDLAEFTFLLATVTSSLLMMQTRTSEANDAFMCGFLVGLSAAMGENGVRFHLGDVAADLRSRVSVHIQHVAQAMSSAATRH